MRMEFERALEWENPVCGEHGESNRAGEKGENER